MNILANQTLEARSKVGTARRENGAELRVLNTTVRSETWDILHKESMNRRMSKGAILDELIQAAEKYRVEKAVRKASSTSRVDA
jgi:hypothetical protein